MNERRKYITITLAARAGLPCVDAQAIPCGYFAVHTPNGGPLKEHHKGFFFSITHVGTGYLAGVVEGRKEAVKVAKLYSAVLGDSDITEADFALPWSERYKAVVAQWKAIAAEHEGK